MNLIFRRRTEFNSNEKPAFYHSNTRNLMIFRQNNQAQIINKNVSSLPLFSSS